MIAAEAKFIATPEPYSPEWWAFPPTHAEILDGPLAGQFWLGSALRDLATIDDSFYVEPLIPSAFQGPAIFMGPCGIPYLRFGRIDANGIARVVYATEDPVDGIWIDH